jgi:hypothetical protein
VPAGSAAPPEDPEEPDEPDEPDEPEDPEEPDDPEEPEEPDDELEPLFVQAIAPTTHAATANTRPIFFMSASH